MTNVGNPASYWKWARPRQRPASSALRSLHPKSGERSPTVARPCRAPRALHRRASDNAVRHPALCASVPPDSTAPGNASIRSNQLLPPAFGHLADGRARVVAVSRADEYRHRAQQCLKMAGTFRDREARIVLSHMAEVWLRLAERNVPKQTQPAFQQQQQIQPKDDGKE